MLTREFFDRKATEVAKELLGKVVFRRYEGLWLAARVIETEAYERQEKASHASLGFTEKREALFMDPGTIYMYYARGNDTMNVSVRGKGNAVLFKSGFPYLDHDKSDEMVKVMKKLNPINGRKRETERLCSGQTLLCRSLNIKVKDWDKAEFDREELFVKDVGYSPERIIQTTRLGIPEGRDEHLPYRFIDEKFVDYVTKKPKEEEISYL